MNSWWILLIVWILAALMMSAGWLWQRRRANAGIVDALWASGLAASAILFAILGDGAPAPRIALGVLGGAWGIRLAAHLASRVRSDAEEDGRYAQLRARWHGDQLKFFLMFQFQAGLIALFSLPFLAAARTPQTSPAWIAAGVAIWVFAVIGETIADRQLARFRTNPANRGKTMRAGLWRYSRHPNYFFEWLHWFAYVALGVGSPLWALSWIGPVLMFVFLRFLSGIPFTEAQALRTRGTDYRVYQQTTPMLFPWFPTRSER